MHSHPKLILLNGPVAVGKSTMAERYAKDHPLALALNGDEIIAMLGGWLTHESIARERVFDLSKSMVNTHLAAGYSVIMPYLLVHPDQAVEFEKIAETNKARFYEIALMASSKQEALDRALERGTWGEPDTEPITPANMHIVEDIYDRMASALAERPNTIRITVVKGKPDDTYNQLMQILK
jgi:predicted kinase